MPPVPPDAAAELFPMKTSLRLLAVCGALSASLAFADSKTKTLDVYWVDSEGGGSTLLVTPNDESVLIDTGNPGGRDPGRIVEAAKKAGLNRIDYVLITHWHGDHFGGAAEIAQQIPIGTLYERAIPDGDPDGRATSSWPLQSKAYREIQTKRERLAAGVVIPLKPVAGGPALTIKCLGADKKFVEATEAQKKSPNSRQPSGTAPKEDTTDNANSAVFLVSFGGFRFFDGGDLTWHQEEKLVSPHNLVGAVDVYQTNHHGLDVSNNPLLVQSLEPTVVVMNNGPRKGGQPGSFAAVRSAPSVQALYQVHKSFNAPDANGADEFIANMEDLRGADAARCTAHLIKMSVAPDGKSYTITNEAKGHSKTYRTKL